MLFAGLRMRYNDTKNKRRRHILKRKNIEKDEKLMYQKYNWAQPFVQNVHYLACFFFIYFFMCFETVCIDLEISWFSIRIDGDPIVPGVVLSLAQND